MTQERILESFDSCVLQSHSIHAHTLLDCPEHATKLQKTTGQLSRIEEVEGRLPGDKEKMLAVIRRFQDLSPEERDNFKVGRRLGVYTRLSDLNDSRRHDEVQRVMDRLKQDFNGDLDEAIFSLMHNFN